MPESRQTGRIYTEDTIMAEAEQTGAEWMQSTGGFWEPSARPKPMSANDQGGLEGDDFFDDEEDDDSDLDDGEDDFFDDDEEDDDLDDDDEDDGGFDDDGDDQDD